MRNVGAVAGNDTTHQARPVALVSHPSPEPVERLAPRL